MAYKNVCVRCGYEEQDHRPNLVNEPAGSEPPWFEKVRPGFTFDILKCMETPHDSGYTSKLDTLELYWGQIDYNHGYQSPDPELETKHYDAEINRYRHIDQSIIINGRAYVGD